MRTTNSNIEIKRQNKIKIVQYILKHEKVSRQELAVALGFSLPTVFQNVTELMELGMVCEAGEYGSTGGRKAKVLKIKEGFCCAAGIEITKDDICFVLVDLNQKLDCIERKVLPYENTQEYYSKLGEAVGELLKKNGITAKGTTQLAGVGISVPGIIDHDLGMLRESYELGVENVSIRHFSKYIPHAFCCESSANCSAYAVLNAEQKSAVYLSLSDTVRGAVFIDGKVYKGDNFCAAEFGHTIVQPGGRSCWCGKKGCLNAYCSSEVLTEHGAYALEQFFGRLETGEPEYKECWEEYLEYLAMQVANIRMAFDCDIILGGKVGRHLIPYMAQLEEHLQVYNMTDFDFSYLSVDPYQQGSSAIGAACYMLERYVENLHSGQPGGS